MYAFKEGKVNPDAFAQDKIWYDGNGVAHIISELPYSYAKNIISKLHKMGLYNNNSNSPLVKAVRKRMNDAKPTH